MDSKLKRIYVPMTETGFYILFCLQTPQHGYGISQQVRRMTGGTLTIDVVREGGQIRDLFLTGPTNIVCKGEITDENLKL